MRAEHRNAILKARFDARSRERQPTLWDSRADLAAKRRHERLLAELEQTRTRLLSLQQIRVAA